MDHNNSLLWAQAWNQINKQKKGKQLAPEKQIYAKRAICHGTWQGRALVAASPPLFASCSGTGSQPYSLAASIVRKAALLCTIHLLLQFHWCNEGLQCHQLNLPSHIATRNSCRSKENEFFMILLDFLFFLHDVRSILICALSSKFSVDHEFINWSLLALTVLSNSTINKNTQQQARKRIIFQQIYSISASFIPLLNDKSTNICGQIETKSNYL